MGMKYSEAVEKVLHLPMGRWLGIARHYDVTATEVVMAVSDGRISEVADVVTLLAANEAQRAESVANGEPARDQFGALEELSFLQLMEKFGDEDPVDREAEIAAAAARAEDAEGAGFPDAVGEAAGPVGGDGGRVVAEAPGADVSGPVDQPGDVQPAVAG